MRELMYFHISLLGMQQYNLNQLNQSHNLFCAESQTSRRNQAVESSQLISPNSKRINIHKSYDLDGHLFY